MEENQDEVENYDDVCNRDSPKAEHPLLQQWRKEQEKAEARLSKHMWDYARFSPTFLKPDVMVYVVNTFSVHTHLVQAVEDLEDLEELQRMMEAYTSNEDVEPFTFRKPIQDELVIAKYEGKLYRGRVLKFVTRGTMEVIFVDYGQTVTYNYDEVYEVPANIAQLPIYGLTIKLLDVLNIPDIPPNFQLREDLKEDLLKTPFTLEMKVKKIEPSFIVLSFPAKLWKVDENGEKELFDEYLVAAVEDWKCNWTDLTETERIELERWTEISSYLRETIEYVREHNEWECQEKGKKHRRFVFHMDNVDFPYYHPNDLCGIGDGLFHDPVVIEVTNYKNLGDIRARLVGQSGNDIDFDATLESRCNAIESWIKSRSEKDLEKWKTDFDPQIKQICVVQWPEKWQDVAGRSESHYGNNWARDLWKDPIMDVFVDEFKQFGGKWFRATCLSKLEKTGVGKNCLYEMELFDIGKKALIQGYKIYPIPHKFMVYFPMSIRLSLYLSGYNYYSMDADKKWGYLFPVGMRVKIKVFWVQWDVLFGYLVDPTQEQLEKHYNHPRVQQAIERYESQKADKERHKKVKKMSVLKGTFQKNMDRVRQEEKMERLWRQYFKKYFQLGRVDPRRIFTLRIPNPIPRKYRDKSKYRVVNDDDDEDDKDKDK